MRSTFKLAALVAALLAAAPAFADITNGPDPYASAYGFDKPEEATWGEWSRGTGDSLYAEWDTFVDGSYGTTTDRTSATDVGSYGATDVYAAWNSGTFRAGSGNLYSFSVTEEFAFNLTDTTPITGPVRAVMQTEGWGMDIDLSTVLLNGVAPSFSDVTYLDTNYSSSFGAVALTQRLFYWDLSSAASNYSFTFSSDGHSLSLAQVAVDIGQVAAVPEPQTYALMLAGLAVLGVAARHRRQA
jgi:PEP-CTERM motif